MLFGPTSGLVCVKGDKPSSANGYGDDARHCQTPRARQSRKLVMSAVAGAWVLTCKGSVNATNR